uniref:Uncharacterized protein n=1 Tax=Rangifer tarandus platyrhynchus TaxID=3082113 RepID=A0ACB0FC23_RANTA|nr:unnamed protein product [Rangifer tarandus platyrhynchus]
MRAALPPAAGGRENAGGDGPSPAAGCGAGRTRAAGLETAGGGWGFRTTAPPPCEDLGRTGRRLGCTPPAPSLSGALCEVGGAQQPKCKAFVQHWRNRLRHQQPELLPYKMASPTCTPRLGLRHETGSGFRPRGFGWVRAGGHRGSRSSAWSAAGVRVGSRAAGK